MLLPSCSETVTVLAELSSVAETWVPYTTYSGSVLFLTHV